MHPSSQINRFLNIWFLLSSTVKSLSSGNNGQFLTLSGGKPDWGDLPLFNGKQNGLVQTPAEDVRTGSFLSMDGTWKIPYGDATTTTHGLMTAADKVKLNGIEAGAKLMNSLNLCTLDNKLNF